MEVVAPQPLHAHSEMAEDTKVDSKRRIVMYGSPNTDKKRSYQKKALQEFKATDK